MNRAVVVRAKRFPVSFRISSRVPLVLASLVLTTLLLIVAAIAVGAVAVPPAEVVRSLLGTGSGEFDFIVRALRLPRIVIALVTGVALGTAGTILQGLTRNPLAAPEIIGITAGANVAAVLVAIVLPGIPLVLMPVAAFGGAVVATAIVYALAWRGGMSPTRLILVGIGITMVGQAVVGGIINFAPVFRVTRVIGWLSGSVYGRGWVHLWPSLAWVVVLLPVAFVLSRRLDVLQLGSDVARGLGVKLERTRALLLLSSVALAAAAVAVAGPVGFVGLLAPHISRFLVPNTHTGLMPTAALVGGLMVLFADTIGRTVLAPIEIPVGVVTAIVGVPYFLFLLLRMQHEFGR